MIRTYFLLILISIACISNINAQTQVPTQISTNDVQTGSYWLTTEGVSTSNDQIGPYYINYRYYHYSIPLLILGIKGMQAQPINFKYIIEVDSIQTSQFSLNLTINKNKWKIFDISYCVISSSIPGFYLFLMNLNTQNTTLTKNIKHKTLIGQYDLNRNANNTEEDLLAISFLSGVNSTLLDQYKGLDFSLNVTADENSSSIIRYKITASPQNLIHSLRAYVLIHDRNMGKYQRIKLFNFKYQMKMNLNRKWWNQDLLNYKVTEMSNLFYGLNEFSYTNGLGFQFYVWPNGLNQTYLYIQNYDNTVYENIEFTFLHFKQLYCDNSTSFYEADSNLCYSSCPSGYYTDYNKKMCIPCSLSIEGCQQCSFSYNCSKCMDKYYQTYPTCSKCHPTCLTCQGSSLYECVSCDTQKYLNYDKSCACSNGLQPDPFTGQCKSNCKTSACLNCYSAYHYNGVSEVCTQCNRQTKLQNAMCICKKQSHFLGTDNICYHCHETCLTCSGPAQNQCLSCDAAQQKRKFNASSLTCQCMQTFEFDTFSMSCQKKIMNETCPQLYIKNNHTEYCEQICGDGVRIDLECDDGDLINGDGCNDRCQIQPDFICVDYDNTRLSYCHYQKPINFTLVRISVNFDNYMQYEAEFKISPPNLKLFKKLDYSCFWMSLYYGNDGNLSMNSGAWMSKNSSFSDRINVNFWIWSDMLKPKSQAILTLNQYSNSWCSYTIPNNNSTQNSTKFSLKSTDGLALYPYQNYYTDDLQKKIQTYSLYSKIAVYVALGLFVITLFYRKMIGLELMVLIQSSYLSYSTLSYAHPFASAIKGWKYVLGGYNKWMFLPEPTDQLNSIYHYLGFKPIFWENVNLMIGIVVAVYVFSFCLFILSLCLTNRTKHAALKFFRQVTFGLLLFLMSNIVTSLCIQYENGILQAFNLDQYSKYVNDNLQTSNPVQYSKYENGNLQEFNHVQYTNVFKPLTLTLIFICTVVYLYSCSSVTDAHAFYKKESKLSHLQPIFILIKTAAMALGVYAFRYVGSQALIGLISMSAVYFLFVLLSRPFNNKIDYLRSLVIQLSICFVFVSRFKQSSKITSDDQSITFDEFEIKSMPIEYGLIGISLCLSILSFLYHLRLSIKMDNKIEPLENESEVNLSEIDKKKESKNLDSTLDNTYTPYKKSKGKRVIGSNVTNDSFVQLYREDSQTIQAGISKRKLNQNPEINEENYDVIDFSNQ